VQDGMMEKQINESITSILENVKPSLGGADIRLRSIEKGVVTLEYHKSLSNPSACHVDRTKTTKDLVIETIEDDLKKVVPELTSIVIIGED
jgi:hypothetical protein